MSYCPVTYTLLRGPLESGQYTAEDYTQVLDDHRVLASVGSVGDCYDNALAESFVDSLKTELIADRVWRTNAQLELGVVTHVGWFTTAGCTPRSGTDRPSSTNASMGAGRARAPTASGSGRPNRYRSTRRQDPGLSAGWIGGITLTDIVNYSTTNDSPSNPGKSKLTRRQSHKENATCM